MSKRKVVVECQVDYIILHPMHANFNVGWIKTSQKVEVETGVKIKNKKNIGGELWDWAQSHWDEFLDEEGPEVTIDGEAYKTQLRWCCVGGVTDLKGKHLPIEQKTWRKSDNPKRRHKQQPRKKTEVSHSYPSGKNDSDMKPNNPAQKENSAGGKVLSFEERKAKKIEEALAKDD